MSKSADLTVPQFTNEAAAIEALEASRWPGGDVSCPHCGSVNVHRMGGKTQAGMFICNDCRDKFTGRTGTVMERSHIPVHKWLLAIHLMNSSKKGVSAHQLHRALGLTYKSAWFLAHRIREAMKDRIGPANPMGGKGKIMEADETYFGKLETPRPRSKYLPPYTKGGKSGPAGKRAVVGLVERGGNVRTFHVHRATKEEVGKIVRTNVSRESKLHTDESSLYTELGKEFADHQTVHHSSEEYVRYTKAVLFPDGQPYVIHTNTMEGYFSIFKRGMRGIYQHCGEAHLHRYLAEFDFRYNHRTALGFNDNDRAAAALKGIEGKRLTYRRPYEAQDPPF